MCGKIRGVVVKSKCVSVFIKPRSEATSTLSHISHIAVRTCQFVHPRLRVFVRRLLLSTVHSELVSFMHETYQCRMYSSELLIMGREDARNMYSFITE